MRDLGIQGATRAKKRFTTKSDPPTSAPRTSSIGTSGPASPTSSGWRSSPTPRRGRASSTSPSSSTSSPDASSAGRRRQRRSTNGYSPFNNQVLLRSVESGQYTAISYTERIDDVGAAPSIGTVGDSFDNAMAESVIGLSRPSCTATPPPWSPTAGPGRGSTTSRSPPAPGSHGSTTSACTQSSATRRRPSSRPTTVTGLSPTWLENQTNEPPSNSGRFSTDAYEGAVPADLVLVCGVFGNVPPDSIENTVRRLPQLCAPGATVIWTRHRRKPDLTPRIRGWFRAASFVEVSFHAPTANS